MCGDGSGFSIMTPIIHDFLCYNIPVTRNLSTLLEKSLSPDHMELIHRVADEAAALKMPLYVVGGFVRDLLLGRAGMDFDLVVEGDAVTLARELVRKYDGKITVHEKFGTAKWFLPKNLILDTGAHDTLDVVSARSETYKHPAALPTVELGSLADDLRRRDFIINALALRLDGPHFGELRDDLGGLDDLERGIVRVLHPRSFVDDPTRMYRAVRYEQRYGFKIADENLALIPEASPLVEKLSAQRLRHELDLILDEPKAASMLARLDELDLLESVHPALAKDVRRKTKGFDLVPSLPHLSRVHLRWMLWLMDLPVDQIKSLNRRLHFTTTLLRDLIASSKLLSDLSSFIDLKPSQCVERLDRIPLPVVGAASLVAHGKPKQKLEKYISEWRHVKPHTTGHDLKKLGLEPGPRYKKILWKLRAAWLDGKISSVMEERKLLENLIR